MELNPQWIINFPKGRIYGEQGNIGTQCMIPNLKFISEGNGLPSYVLKNINDFISSDAENPNNIKFKKVVLQNAQKNPDIFVNELLSWLFCTQKQFKSAFCQGKAIYKKGAEIFATFTGLGKLGIGEQDEKTAKDIIWIYFLKIVPMLYGWMPNLILSI